MKKLVLLLLLTTLILTGCDNVPIIYHGAPNEAEDVPYIAEIYDGNLLACFYSVTAEGYGTLCTGRAYGSRTVALDHAVEVHSAGHNIYIDMIKGDNETYRITMTAGDEEMIKYTYIDKRGVGSDNFLYVIVN